MEIRLAKPSDARSLLDIYAPYVENTAITFEYEVPTVEDFANRVGKTLEKYPYLVAEEDGLILGYAYASTYYARAAYDWAVELSVYVSLDSRGQGVGTKLYDALEYLLDQMGYVHFLACISLPNEASLALHRKRGYQQVAHFPKIGYKFERWHDIVWLQKSLEKQATPHKTFKRKGVGSVKKKYLIILLLSIGLITLSGCQMIENWIKNAKEEWIGLEMTVRTYDENSQLIDQMSGKSLSISRNEEFDSVDAEGNSKEDSSVLKITLGKYEIDHVGSSLIAEEKGLKDVFAQYQKTADVEENSHSVPVLNRMISAFKNDFTGKKKVILIRSQNGTPLAAYAGDRVSLDKSDAPKTSELLIDGKRLVIYRCDYTIYDRELLE
ncbi:Phosphinothricin N-acetyltransferase [Streptococcus gordonii]|uniref:Phosphinothricin N-acetyltransferase n=2 Tax=Streptococcus gordonii TaxID=1302 RepID=A0A139NB84_STRGN|nr:Phosphinothricin N-acetyltransferase [Streptococcus gordonii]